MTLNRADLRHRSVFLLLLIAACRGVENDTSKSTTADSAGITIVTSAASVWGERGMSVDTNPVMRVGAEDADPYQFSFISTARLLEGGGFAVVELSANEIRTFNAEGRHVRSVGRRGRGPGEFQVISGLFPKSGDSLVAYDQIERRATIFPLADGESRVIPAQSVPGARGSFSAFGAFGDGRLLLYNPGSGFRPDLQPGLQWVTTEVVALNPTDGSAQTIARLPSRQQFVLPGGDTKPVVPAHGAIQAVAEGGFYWGTSDRYEMRFYDSTGTLRRILRRPLEPPPVTPAMIETWIAANLETVRKREGEAAVAKYKQSYEEGPFGDRVPLFDRAFVDGEGRLWVGLSEWPKSQTAPRRWSLFAPSGAWLGDVDAPANLRIVDCRDDRVLGIRQEDGEVPYVEVHRLLRK